MTLNLSKSTASLSFGPRGAQYTVTLERARELAPTWDVRVLVGEWRTYAARQKEPPKNPDAAFLGFCKSWYKKRGRNGW
jgi:hypothetical protein